MSSKVTPDFLQTLRPDQLKTAVKKILTLSDADKIELLLVKLNQQ